MGYGVNGNGFGGWNYALIPSRKAQTVEEFVRVGSKVINLSKVVSVNLEVSELGGSHQVTVFFDGGTRWSLYGAEADAVRRFFAGNAMTIVPDDSEDPTVLGDGPCTGCCDCRTKGSYASDAEFGPDSDYEPDDDSLRFEDNIDDCE